MLLLVLGLARIPNIIDDVPVSDKDAEASALRIKQGFESDPSSCFASLALVMQSTCGRLDSDRRKELAVKIMVCTETEDGRGDDLPSSESIDGFLEQLSESQFDRYTKYYANLDSTCFHFNQELKSNENLKKVNNLFSAVSFSAQFIDKVKEQIDSDSSSLIEMMGNLEQRIKDDAVRLKELQSSMLSAVGKISFLNDQAKTFYQAVKGIKLYVMCMLGAFALSFVIPNILTQTTILTLSSILIENNISAAKKTRTVVNAIRYTYIVLCAIIATVGFWQRIEMIRAKFMKEKRKLRGNTNIPKLFSE